MKTFGIVRYNIYCSFTNYGSALKSWALSQAITRLSYRAKLIDYCPEVLKEADQLNPFKSMWNKDAESHRLCELTMPAIRESFEKFDRFYHERFEKTAKMYTADNFDEVVADEGIDGFAMQPLHESTDQEDLSAYILGRNCYNQTLKRRISC